MKKKEKALPEGEKKFRLVTETIQDVFWMSSPGVQKMVYISPAYEEIWGKSISSLYDSPKSFLESVHPGDRQQYKAKIQQYHAMGKQYSCEYRIYTPDGSIRWISERGFPITDEKGECILMTGVCRDITGRKQAEKEIQRRENFLNSIIDQNPYAMWISDDKGNLIRINRACCQLLNIKPKEVVGKYNVLKDNIVTQQGHLPLVESVFKQGKTVQFLIHYDSSQLKHLALEKTAVVILEVTIAPVKDEKGNVTNAIIMHHDITQRKLAEEQIKKALKEKEIMLQEIHHRVKNNLNVIIALLNLQSKEIYSKERAVNAFDETINRVYSMALVHEKLYQSDNLSEIDFKDYIEMMSGHLLKIFDARERVSFEYNIVGIQLDVTTAIPCGLILNELVTNAIKHAFDRQQKGNIHIWFGMKGTNQVQLIVKDDGKGLPTNFTEKDIDSLGFTLINLLVNQIGGKLSISGTQGTEIKITFPFDTNKGEKHEFHR